MIITDGPWEAEQFCLKYILNTFSKTFPQMHLIIVLEGEEILFLKFNLLYNLG